MARAGPDRHHAGVTTSPGLAALVRTVRLDLVLLSRAWLVTYAGNQPLPDLGFSDPHGFLAGSEHVVHLRAEQLALDPAAEPWLLRAMVLRESGEAVGYTNFHAPPDERGMVEIGYQVLPAFRGAGLATEAAEAMWAWAGRHAARVLRASIVPGNEPSLAMVRRASFVQVGEQLDDVDGVELVFERSA